jgi:hypothetical protein
MVAGQLKDYSTHGSRAIKHTYNVSISCILTCSGNEIKPTAN